MFVLYHSYSRCQNLVGVSGPLNKFPNELAVNCYKFFFFFFFFFFKSKAITNNLCMHFENQLMANRSSAISKSVFFITLIISLTKHQFQFLLLTLSTSIQHHSYMSILFLYFISLHFVLSSSQFGSAFITEFSSIYLFLFISIKLEILSV